MQVKNDEKQSGKKRIYIVLLRRCFERLQHCSSIATLCCGKNRRCESSRVTTLLNNEGGYNLYFIYHLSDVYREQSYTFWK